MACYRFENTLSDLQECYEHMESDEKLSSSEKENRNNLIQLCIDIAEEYGEIYG